MHNTADRCLEDASFHDIDGALNELAHADQEFQDWLSAVQHPCAIKRYLEFKSHLVGKARLGAVEFNIVFQRKDGLEVVGHQFDGGDAPSNSEHSLFGYEAYGGRNAQNSRAGRCTDRHNLDVLIHGVQFMEYPEKVIPSLVWLEPANEPFGLRGDAPDLANYSLIKPLLGGSDWEPASGFWLTGPVCADKLADELIESASKIVNNIPDHSTPLDWESFVNAHAPDVLSSVRAWFIGDGVGVFFEKRLNCPVQLLDVVERPRSLQSWAT